MRYIVFGKTQHIARYKLDEIYSDMNKDDVVKYVKSVNCSYIELKNGDFYETKNASDSSRGCKCDSVFVDEDINKDIIDTIIKPCLVCSKLPQNDQIIFY